MRRLETAKVNLEDRKKKLREAAIGFVSEAAEFGDRDGDAMAELESAALNFSAAFTELRNAEGEAEMEYIKSNV